MSASPAARAARIASTPNPLVTATIVTSWPPPPVRCAIVALTCSSRSGRASKLIAVEYNRCDLRLKKRSHALSFGPADEGAERLVRAQMVGAAQEGERAILLAAQRGGIAQLEKWNRERGRDLLRRRLELESLAREQLSELKDRIDEHARACRVHHRSLNAGHPAMHRVGVRHDFEHQPLKHQMGI